ncbi:PepSY domain-containing protein [Lutibacter holmesii]|uniref:PepSY domain-containing protein n=1 Tax=Lutibacter holmesii TaxID=1137985 RepID=A0ABW3WNV4_9FLAO
MTYHPSKKRQAKIIRLFRKVHRKTGALLFVFFFFISVSGLLLGWKNNSNGTIIPKTQNGTSTNLKEWLPINQLHQKALVILHDSISTNLDNTIDRIDIRKNKGIVKFVFENHYWEIQLDGATGNLLSIGKRNSDLIENIHDGSILDKWFNTSKKPFKLIYTTIMGGSLLLFTISGFWLWFGPKIMKRTRKKL